MRDRIITPAELLVRAGKTQRDVAVAMNKREATVSDWTRGARRPRLSFAETLKLCRLLGATLEELCIAFDRVNPDDL